MDVCFCIYPPSNYWSKPLISLKLCRHNGDDPHIFSIGNCKWITKREPHSLFLPHILPVKLFHDSLYVRPESLLTGVLLTVAQLIRAVLLKVWSLEPDWSVVSKEMNSKIEQRCSEIFRGICRVIFYLLNLIIKPGFIN